MSDVFRALDGGWGLAACLENPERCPMHRRCPTRRTWQEMTEALTRVLQRTTLRDLAAPCRVGRRGRVEAYEI
jgi:DNA-binding IscR family transcriptional regulator